MQQFPRGMPPPVGCTMSNRQRKKLASKNRGGYGRPRATPWTSSPSRANIGSLPPEVLMKILSFLDASSLYSVGYVNKQLHAVSNSNSLWYRLYTRDCAESKRKPLMVDEVADGLTSVAIQEKPMGYWKRLLFRKMAGFNTDKWLKQLKVTNPYTGLPRQTEHVLRSVGVTWELTVIDMRRRQCTFKPSRVFFSESSLSLTWYNLADLASIHIHSMQLHGVVPMLFDRHTASGRQSRSPVWRSLMAEVDMKSPNWRFLGACQLVRMKCSRQIPGFSLGQWRDQGDIVFVKMTLHFHKLVERSLLGSVTCPYMVQEPQPMFDDIDPEYGLHGYKVHLELHDMAKPIMSGHFTGLFCRRENFAGNHINLRAISRGKKAEHTAFCDKLCLKWRSEGLDGSLEKCCVVNVTVVDETDTPVWCISTAVPAIQMTDSTSYDYGGETYSMNYVDAGGRVFMDLVWMEEMRQYFLVKFWVQLPVAKINRLYRRNY
ncbi:F-box only protein 15 isoform X2 [Engraulis encrasicolus]|uniref:F-box only protein 15 isoform X2 n=1 Tax=Engraulis encrasicolus TaxID=184585 RepID=UPI002FD4196A